MKHNGNKQNEQELFVHLWRQCRKEICVSRCGADCSMCRPEPWVAKKLLALMHDEMETPVVVLRPAVEKILAESRYAGCSGDALIHPNLVPPLDRQTDLVVETLDRMRRNTQQRNPGRHVPMTSQHTE